MCSLRHLIYLIISSLGVMPRVPTGMHLLVAYIDNITKSIAICNYTYKFVTYPYNTLQEFAVDNMVIFSSHPEDVRKLHI